MIYKDHRLPKHYPYSFPIAFHQLPMVLKAIATTMGKGPRTFYLNTGVSQSDYGHIPLSEGQVWRGGTKQIRFTCEDVPEHVNKCFMMADNPNLPKSYVEMFLQPGQSYIVRPINDSPGVMSKYAYFQINHSEKPIKSII